MEKSRIDSVALLVALIACSVGLLALPGNFEYLTGIAGVVLLLILFAHDQEGYRSGLQSLAFAGVGAFCLVLVSSAPFHYYLGQARDITTEADRHAFLEKWFLVVWVVGVLLGFAVDRVRMSSREVMNLRLTGAIPAMPPAQHAPSFSGPIVVRGRVPNPTVVTPAPPPMSAASTPPPIPFSGPVPPPSEPVPSATSIFQSQAPIFQSQAPPPAAESPAAAFASGPQSPPGSIPPPPAPPIALKQAPPGKETMIYVNLVGEGLNVLRSVRAEHMGRDFYRIVEEMPAGENWEYHPGQVVRCKKKSLSTGKHLVAMEEAPRAS